MTRDWEPRAVAALAMGGAGLLLFLVVLPAFLLGVSALVAGASALLRLRGTPDRPGRVMAGAGMAAGVLSMVLATVFVAVATHSHHGFRPITLPYAQLGLGDCYQRPARLDREVEVVSCGRAHDRQAVAAVDHPAPAGARYPGRTALQQFADEHCGQAYARFVDTPAEQVGLVASDLLPTEGVWRHGSRHVVCAVARPDGRRITGSVTDNTTDLPPPS
ncbi:MAG: hypothetical protein V7605_848 [Acidimicrobiaceae bacterium]